MTVEMIEQILTIVEEMLPFMSEWIATGFAWGTILALISFGIGKAISLLNI